jgi:type II secretory pathway pseudopilin PulG
MINSRNLTAFTLIEVLISIALTGLLIVLLNNQITGSLKTDQKIKDKMEYKIEIETILAHLEADIQTASNLPSGYKSVVNFYLKDQLHISIKKFGISAIDQDLLGAEITWKFGNLGISRNIKSKDGKFERYLSKKELQANVIPIGINIFKLIIKCDGFTKSKLFKL